MNTNQQSLNLHEIVASGKIPEEEFRSFLRQHGSFPKLADAAVRFVVSRYGRTKMIHAVHSSGRLIPLPLSKLLKKSHTTNRQYVLKAMRDIIDDQVAPLRQKGMHVDHVLPFVVLAETWAYDNEVDLESLKVTKSRKLKRLSLGTGYDESWAKFHKEQATLQVIPKETNLRKGSSYLT